MDSSVVVTRGLTKVYRNTIGIEDLDLEVRRGEIFGFLGPNGAGKTTTIRLLLGLLRVSRGSARVLGLDVARSSRAVRSRLSYLPAELSLYGHLTGIEVLRYFGSLRGGLDEAHARELTEQLGAELNRPLCTLSHGNRQKIGLVQAMVHRPELLLLDEPSIGLDPLVQQELYRLLASLRAEGCTVFLSSHVLPEVERVCDRVAIVRAGRLVAVEDVATLRQRAVRRLEMTFARTPDEDSLRSVPGVEELAVEGGRLRCTVRGPLGPFLTAAGEFGVVDLISHEPGLEELFLSHYSSGGRRA